MNSSNDSSKRPTRRNTKKRKAAASLKQDDEDGTESRVAGVSAQELSHTLLSWLPSENVTVNNQHAQKLIKSFDLVRAELQHRANCMTAQGIKSGENSDVLLSRVAIPAAVMQNVLEFLPRPQAVHSASLVSKSWLAIVRAPAFWTVLDHHTGLLDDSQTVSNMTALLKLLKRPQFSSLRTLVPPYKVQARKNVFQKVAEACPLLEELDLGVGGRSHMKIDDASLLALPELFPHLKSIRFKTYRVSNAGLKEFCRIMGDRLVDLGIREEHENLLSNETLATIGSSCSNLQHFYVDFFFQTQGQGRDEGLMDLLKKCIKLKSFRLIHSASLEQGIFEYILNKNNAVTLERLFVARHEGLKANASLCDGIAAKVGSFEVLSEKEEYDRADAHFRKGETRNRFYWLPADN